jgi:CRISPR-associated endonuclease Cas1
MSKKSYKSRFFYWFPYTNLIDIKGNSVTFNYNGGVETTSFDKIHSILFYGSHPPLKQKFLEKCSENYIPIIIHRRNKHKAIWINSSLLTNKIDVVSKQILTREDLRKRKYIVRQLLKAKFKSMKWLISPPSQPLRSNMTLDELVGFESWHARKYWDLYFEKLGHPEWNRRSEEINPVNQALNAVSKFVSGICLRWLTFHKFSPYHAFLHKPTSYPSLIYDVIEPYRGYLDKIVFDSSMQAQKNGLESQKFVAFSIEKIKQLLDVKVYCHSTQQIATFHELIHGIVLALRVYLLGENERFIVPLPSKPKSGRPVEAGYKLYGRRAGKTDFWDQAKITAKKFDKELKKIS